MKSLYCCFSIPLKNYLASKGVSWEVVALHPNTKSTMWIYIKNEKLNKCLEEWSQGSK